MGKTSITFKVSLLGNIINVIGNAVCIFGLRMGAAGVAIPSLISRLFMGMVLYVMLNHDRYEVHFIQGRLKADWKIIQKILYIGIPSGIENGIFQLGRVLVVSIISGFGTVQIAANGVANSLDSIGTLTGTAMNLAMITVIGRCVGAGEESRVRYYLKKLILITYVATAVVNIPVLLALKPILSIYRLSTQTMELAWLLVMIHNGTAMFLWPMSFTFPNMLRACNDVKYPMVVSTFSMFVFRVGFSFLMGERLGMGAVGVWIAMIIDWIFRVTCFVLRYIHGDWKKTMKRQ